MKLLNLEDLVQEVEKKHTQVGNLYDASQVYFDIYCELSTVHGKGQENINALDLWSIIVRILNNNTVHHTGTIYMCLMNRYYIHKGKVKDIPAVGAEPGLSIIEDLNLLIGTCLDIYEECLREYK